MAVAMKWEVVNRHVRCILEAETAASQELWSRAAREQENYAVDHRQTVGKHGYLGW